MKVIDIVYSALQERAEDNKGPGGYYFTPRKEGQEIMIEEGEYGRWHRTLRVKVEEVEYIEY